MDHDSPPFPTDLVQMHPGLGLLRFAALLSEGADADEETLDAMFEQMEIGAVDRLPPRDVWLELERGLMGRKPSTMLHALRACGVLEIILPEVHALFGVPQIADDPGEVDLGELLLRSLDEAASIAAPLDVRYALLTMNVGKSDSPKEHLPAHYRHMERGAPRVAAISDRFGVSAGCRDLARLALYECERVHRTSEVRAGPVAAMLLRLDAFDNPGRFARLMSVARCDYFGHGGRSEPVYPKARLLERALAACATVDATATGDELMSARAAAIALAFRSQRWSDDLA
ncbi:tRNA nucleotidyltransferase [Xanthobacter agilis]|jgi:tRNA nucleotidyltransferase (CCA-adding enzyme)|uniref:tRNA nucleotidyltransferase (CCA-adding enzyme) n=1 Tax=Xanthobacter agilis TaxID=47492 RepID=A0ABU0LBA5_XANAG|nr:tRNA nucleotidyltransferase [Xanthobacter agilis]MDQ0504403.1 tRNA nucleotidyltransferase (CCA-adding enzyme) [Xanthobacter agilis]